MTNQRRKTNWVEAICMVICAALLIIFFRMMGFGRIWSAVLGGVGGTLLGMGIYYVFTLLLKQDKGAI